MSNIRPTSRGDQELVQPRQYARQPPSIDPQEYYLGQDVAAVWELTYPELQLVSNIILQDLERFTAVQINAGLLAPGRTWYLALLEHSRKESGGGR